MEYPSIVCNILIVILNCIESIVSLKETELYFQNWILKPSDYILGLRVWFMKKQA